MAGEALQVQSLRWVGRPTESLADVWVGDQACRVWIIVEVSLSLSLMVQATVSCLTVSSESQFETSRGMLCYALPPALRRLDALYSPIRTPCDAQPSGVSLLHLRLPFLCAGAYG